MSLEPTAGARNFVAVLAENIRISGKVWGRAPQKATDPTRRFICTHGWLDNANTWDPVIPILVEAYGDSVSFLALDFAGHGWSDTRSENDEYVLHRNVYDVLQVADLLGWDQFGIMGHSMGGGIGLVIAGTFPERVSALISVDILGPVSIPANRQTDLLKRSWNDRLGFLKRNPKPIYNSVSDAALARARTGEVSLDVAKILTDRGLGPVPGDDGERWTWRSDQRLRAAAPGMFTNDAVLEMINRVKAPVLVVLAPTRTGSGKQLDGRVDMLGSRGTVVRLPNARHHLHMEPETVELFVLAVKSFLEERVWKTGGSMKAKL
ncbi:Alpha/Beta hydrolase protein [Cladochytrium replicatum]|nr:Alpha/Beta hydrolase protein [Cladochytrium replicatum]